MRFLDRKPSPQNEAIIRHPWGAVLLPLSFIWFFPAAALGLVDARAGSDVTVAVAAVGVMVAVAALTLVLPRVLQRRPDDIVAMRWRLSTVPYLTAMWSDFAGAPEWVYWPGFWLTMIPLAASVGQAVRAREEEVVGA